MRYETVIGVEVHVELSTKTKIFCSCPAQFGGEPNTQCCPVCLGMPGSLPVLNKKAVEYAIKAGLALNCRITQYTKFDRKNYFYPDLPKAYQISQLHLPICHDGYLEVDGDDGKKPIRIHEIHMEEDAGKLIHDSLTGETKCDYNRAGIPLIEIVSEPDFRSAGEVVNFLEKLRTVLLYLEVSDCKMQEGSMRADVNISVRLRGQKELGTRTEMKNMASLKAIARAIEYESARQTEILEQGREVAKQSRRWDDDKGTSFAMRGKEDAQDYRFFPEPDLPPVECSDKWIEEIGKGQPELADAKIARYTGEHGLPEYDARMITSEKSLAIFFEKTTGICGNPKEVSNWILGDVMRKLGEDSIQPKDMRLTAENMSEIIGLVLSGSINRNSARELFEKAFYGPMDVLTYAKAHDMEQIGDESIIEDAVDRAFAANEKSVADYKTGKEKAFGFLVGQTMRELNGKADPAIVNRVVQEKLKQ